MGELLQGIYDNNTRTCHIFLVTLLLTWVRSLTVPVAASLIRPIKPHPDAPQADQEVDDDEEGSGAAVAGAAAGGGGSVAAGPGSGSG